jgi:hypothetical protein
VRDYELLRVRSNSYYSAFPVIPTWRDPGLCCGLVLVC